MNGQNGQNEVQFVKISKTSIIGQSWDKTKFPFWGADYSPFAVRSILPKKN